MRLCDQGAVFISTLLPVLYSCADERRCTKPISNSAAGCRKTTSSRYQIEDLAFGL